MASQRVAREVDAAPAVVWAIVTDLERSAQVIGAIVSVERLDGGTGFDVGTRWRETRRMFGREASEVLEVTEVDHGRAYTVEADGAGVHYTTVMAVEPSPVGTLLSMEFEGKATTTAARIGALLGRLFSGRLERLLQQDLDDIAAEAEKDRSSDPA